MTVITKFLENVPVLLTVFFGFILGCVTVLILEIAFFSVWVVAAVFVAVLACIFAFMWITDRLMDTGLEFFARKVNTPEEMERHTRKTRRRKHRLRIAFVIGFAFAFVLTRVFGVERVMEWI